MMDSVLVAVFALLSLFALVILCQAAAAGVQRTRRHLRATREQRTYGRPARS